MVLMRRGAIIRVAVRADHFRPIADAVAKHRDAEAVRTKEQQLSSLRRLVEGCSSVAACATPSNHWVQPTWRWGRWSARRRDLLGHCQNLPLFPKSCLKFVDVDILHIDTVRQSQCRGNSY